MSPALRTFLDERLATARLHAWGVRLPDRKIDCRCLSDFLQPAQVEQTLNHALMAADGLPYYQLNPTRLQWTFDQMTILLALRTDQYALCLLLPRQEGVSHIPEDLLSEFNSLALEDTRPA